jgi:hypothetical protein
MMSMLYMGYGKYMQLMVLDVGPDSEGHVPLDRCQQASTHLNFIIWYKPKLIR